MERHAPHTLTTEPRPVMHAESPITVACIQMEPKIGEKEANVARSLEKIGEAAGKGAKLIVLPELCNSGYVFASRQEAFALAETVPSGPSTQPGRKRPIARRGDRCRHLRAGRRCTLQQRRHCRARRLHRHLSQGASVGCGKPVFRARRSGCSRVEGPVRPNGGRDLL